MEGNIIYEVNLKLKNEIAEEYYTWLKEHIKEILQIDGFVRAWTSIPQGKENDLGNKYYTVSYLIESEVKMNNYLQNYASKMRADAINKFGDKFSAERRILNILDQFN